MRLVKKGKSSSGPDVEYQRVDSAHSASSALFVSLCPGRSRYESNTLSSVHKPANLTHALQNGKLGRGP